MPDDGVPRRRSRQRASQIRANKDEWIIKPTDHYGADDVYAGCDVTQEEWEGFIDEFANERAGYPFIAQRYIRPFKTETLPPDTGIYERADDRCRGKRRKLTTT